MATIEEMQAALETLKAQEEVMLPDRERLREEAAAARDALNEHSAGFKVVRDARAELERRIQEQNDSPPISDRTDALIQAVEAVASADSPKREAAIKKALGAVTKEK